MFLLNVQLVRAVGQTATPVQSRFGASSLLRCLYGASWAPDRRKIGLLGVTSAPTGVAIRHIARQNI